MMTNEIMAYEQAVKYDGDDLMKGIQLPLFDFI